MRRIVLATLLVLLAAPSLASAQPEVEQGLLAPHLAALGDKKKEIRLKAVKKIGALGLAARSAAPRLGVLLQEDPYDKVADEAARALAQIGPLGVPELVKAAQHEKVAVRNRALWALGLMGPAGKQAVGTLKVALLDPQANLSALAAIALGEMGADAKPAVPALCQALHDRDPKVYTQAAIALRNIGADAIPAVRELLEDDDANARLGGLQAATLIGRDAAGAATEIAKLLQDESPALRIAAADALASIGPQAKAAIPALIGVMREKNGAVQQHAFQALLRVGSSDVPGLLASFRKLNAEGHWAFPYVLRQFGPKAKDAVKPLIAQLQAPDDSSRMSAALALGEIGKEAREAIPGLQKAMKKDKNAKVRHAAAFSLARIMADPPEEIAKKMHLALAQMNRDLQQAIASLPQLPAQRRPLNRQAFFDDGVQAAHDHVVNTFIMASVQTNAAARLKALGPCGREFIGNEGIVVSAAALERFHPEGCAALIRGMHSVALHDLGFC